MQSFKLKYRRQHLSHVVDLVDNQKDQAIRLDDAIRYLWIDLEQVTPTTKSNWSWKTAIIDVDGTISSVTETGNDLLDDMTQYQALCLDIEIVIADKFISRDNDVPTEGVCSNEDIVT